jgi:hypothetical protein
MAFHDKKVGHQRKKKPAVTLPGVVEKVFPPLSEDEPEKAQIAVEGADDLYREIRIENKLKSVEGNEVKLKPGAKVDVTVEAPSDSVQNKT